METYKLINLWRDRVNSINKAGTTNQIMDAWLDELSYSTIDPTASMRVSRGMYGDILDPELIAFLEGFRYFFERAVKAYREESDSGDIQAIRSAKVMLKCLEDRYAHIEVHGGSGVMRYRKSLQ